MKNLPVTRRAPLLMLPWMLQRLLSRKLQNLRRLQRSPGWLKKRQNRLQRPPRMLLMPRERHLRMQTMQPGTPPVLQCRKNEKNGDSIFPLVWGDGGCNFAACRIRMSIKC